MNFENICTPTEANFLLKNLKHTDNVLEWGSGQLSLQIVSKVKHVSVITHDLSQYALLQENKHDNIETILAPINNPHQSDDGTYDEFKDYIHASKELRNRFGKFNVIIIRGRARVECAKFCKEIAQDDCRIFIQDFNHPNSDYLRAEYFEAEKHLTRVGGEFTMYMFVLNKNTPIIDKTIGMMGIGKAFNATDGLIIRGVYSNEDVINHNIKMPKTKKVTELPKKERKRVTSVAKKIFNQQ